MNKQEGTSFIPQRPTKGKLRSRGVRKLYVLSYISYVLFFGSILSAGGVYFYKFTLENQLETQKQILSVERQEFSEGDLESIRDLQKRMESAETRLNNHVSLLSIFEALERVAVQAIKFEGFTYQRNNDEFPIVTFTGSTERFNSLLFQRNMFENEPVLAGSSFVEVRVEELIDASELKNDRPIVSFNLEKTVDTSLIQYTPRLLEVQTTDVPPTQEGQAQTQDQQNDQQQMENSDQAQGDMSEVMNDGEGVNEVSQ